MAKIFITGSSDGLGLMAAEALLKQNHNVFVHARNEKRSKDLTAKLPGAEAVLIADLGELDQIKKLAEKVNAYGKFDAIIHNAAISSGKQLFKVNVLAPYMLTAEIQKPNRLVYLSSGMHKSGRPLNKETEVEHISYSDSKFQLTLLMKYVAARYQDVNVNAVDPGWVPTKMGGAGAPDDLQKGYETQIWLATSKDDAVKVSGKYFHHHQQQKPHQETNNIDFQQNLVAICKSLSGAEL